MSLDLGIRMRVARWAGLGRTGRRTLRSDQENPDLGVDEFAGSQRLGIPPLRTAKRAPHLALVLGASLAIAGGATLMLVHLRASGVPLDADGSNETVAQIAYPGPADHAPRIFVAPASSQLVAFAAPSTSAALPAPVTPASAPPAAAFSALSMPLDRSSASQRGTAPQTGDANAQRLDDVLMVDSAASAPSATASDDTAHARRHRNGGFSIGKGSLIGCVLETAIDSTKSGLVTCTVTEDVTSDDARQVLIERGTHMIGEYAGDSKIGEARIAVLWTRLRKSDGTTVDLASPGVDQEGRAGYAGNVDNHWMTRIGAAVLVSFIEDAVSAATTPRGNGTTFVLPNTASTGTSLSQRVLDASINIPPTITVKRGARIDIMVAKDIDFESVYASR